ncbi:MAG: response regulator [Thermodesulfobacteriota bacterium]|jgi:two-component system response regulator NreC
MNRQKTRVLIAEDHTIVRQGLSALINRQPDMQVVGEAQDGKEAVEKTKELCPDVVLMDIAMKHMNGLEATARIKKMAPEVKVLVLTMYENEEYIFQILRAGASGYLLKEAPMTDLIAAIKAVNSGESYLSPSISKKVIEDYIRRAELGEKSRINGILSAREREILQLIAEGHTYEEIASILCISKKTVETHRANIMDKLNIHDKVGLVKYALRKGLIKL